jgi:membrane associated rhomboid family serine protease
VQPGRWVNLTPPNGSILNRRRYLAIIYSFFVFVATAYDVIVHSKNITSIDLSSGIWGLIGCSTIVIVLNRKYFLNYLFIFLLIGYILIIAGVIMQNDQFPFYKNSEGLIIGIVLGNIVMSRRCRFNCLTAKAKII